ncbi:MAG: undecaprenyl-diphosphate phosphatase [Lentisphaeria bacterium]|nr:undecaprenyl-diphosphate phosphatase [Lentisphaeria bacterium]
MTADSLVQIIILAIIQGIAEFLPISSSGHLALLGNLLKIDPEANLTLGILLHAGSLLAICVFYYRTLLGFLHKNQRHLALMVFVGTLPAAAVGLTLKLTGLAGTMFDFPLLIGLCFLITATLLRMTEKEKLIVKPSPDAPPTTLQEITPRQALTVGFAQAFAILPGISRSGSTIAAGILCGINREAAGNFSFLLALPVIGGAVLLELLETLRAAQTAEVTQSSDGLQLFIGFAVSALVSFGALSLLMKLIRKGKLAWFSWYLYCIGIAVIIWQITQR